MSRTVSPSVSESNTRGPTSTPAAIKRPAKKGSDVADDVLREALHQLQSVSSTDVNDAEGDFGQVVSNELRQINGENKIHAQKLIYEILYLGKLGKLTSATHIM